MLANHLSIGAWWSQPYVAGILLLTRLRLVVVLWPLLMSSVWSYLAIHGFRPHAIRLFTCLHGEVSACMVLTCCNQLVGPEVLYCVTPSFYCWCYYPMWLGSSVQEGFFSIRLLIGGDVLCMHGVVLGVHVFLCAAACGWARKFCFCVICGL